MLSQVSVTEFMQDLASNSSAPGGGSAAAISGALGASLISMVCRLTIGKAGYESVQADMEQYLVKSDELYQRLLVLMEEDTQVFSQVMACFKLPKDTEQEKLERTAQIQRAYEGAADVPLRIGQAAMEVIDLCIPVGEKGNTNVLSDVGVAVHMAYAALESAVINVNVNLPSLKDQDLVQRLRQEMDQWMEPARQTKAAVEKLMQN